MAHVHPMPGQMELFDKKLSSLVRTARELTQAKKNNDNEYLPGNDIAACYAVANASKRSIDRSGLSRDQMVDKINAYWNRSSAGANQDPPDCLRPLTLPMFNNYLSKPHMYRIPAIYVFAIEAITQNLEISRLFVTAQGGQVINREESQRLQLAKVQQTLNELIKHEKELRKMAGF